MKWILTTGTFIVPVVFFVLSHNHDRIKLFLNSLAVLCAVIFGAISSNSIYEIIRDNTVFMTNIHAIFLSPLFLISGAYLGSYLIYRLIIILSTER